MKITEETVNRIAELAKLEFTPEEKKELMGDMNKILAFMEKLNELDTEGAEPLIYMSGQVNALRKDEVVQEITHQEALKNAPKKDSDYFRVPKVLERG
jgi:aspartyl-tRNA(Asn)/glutamyl-tRNA(Gln) amidotransferase subunit C